MAAWAFYDCFLLFHLSAVFSAPQQFLRYLLGSAAAPVISIAFLYLFRNYSVIVPKLYSAMSVI
jgi:hypothetical protein